MAPWSPPDASIRTRVSCCIIAFNEADRIARTIDSVRGLVDEVIVVDSGSTDGTQALAERLGARVVHRDWEGYGPQKRFAEEQARNDFVLNLDADEWLSDALRAELRGILSQERMPASSFRMRMTMVYPHHDRPHLMADSHNYIRLYDRTKTRFAASMVHDTVEPTADVIQLKGLAYHQSFRSIAHLVRKEIGYYELQKREKTKNKALLVLRVFTEIPWQFFKFYFVRGHVFGGFYGFILSVAVAFMRWTRVLVLLGY
ncbi:MAG: hypothetical protein BGP04_11005 [Rhizobiales bacterium 62-17]|nr:glycosyltransferase family 2 protein [Hyphomicrobiales bacterium]OJY05851.1 MAG: hypothetical protein BGP04_11005 [Rhizobiales bacterium 62-17]